MKSRLTICIFLGLLFGAVSYFATRNLGFAILFALTSFGSAGLGMVYEMRKHEER